MKKTSNILITILVAVVFFGNITCVSASSLESKLISPKGNIHSGEIFSIQVKFKGDDLGRVRSLIEYDVDKISYISGGDSEGDNGVISISKVGDGGDINATLKFKAKAKGSAEILISRIEAYDLDEQKMDASKGKTTVKISSAVSKKDNKKEKDEKERKQIDTEQNSGAQEDSVLNTKSRYLPIYLGAIGVVCILLLTVLLVSGRKKRK